MDRKTMRSPSIPLCLHIIFGFDYFRMCMSPRINSSITSRTRLLQLRHIPCKSMPGMIHIHRMFESM